MWTMLILSERRLSRAVSSRSTSCCGSFGWTEKTGAEFRALEKKSVHLEESGAHELSVNSGDA